MLQTHALNEFYFLNYSNSIDFLLALLPEKPAKNFTGLN